MSALRADNHRLGQEVAELRADHRAQDRKIRDLEHQLALAKAKQVAEPAPVPQLPVEVVAPTSAGSGLAPGQRVVGVADRGDPDARAEIDELVAVDVDQDRAVRALDEDGEGARHAVGHGATPTLLQLDRPRTGDRGHEATFGRERRYRGGGQRVGHSSDPTSLVVPPDDADSVAVACLH